MRRSLLLVPLMALATPALAGQTLYVDDDAPPGGDGAGWTTALRFLQDALSLAAGPGSGITEIRVAQGTYRADRSQADPAGTGDRQASFGLVGGVDLLGGYAGIASPDPDQRDPDQFPTVLDGDLAGDDQPGPSGNEENSYQVVTGSDLQAPVLLEGLVVRGGYGATGGAGAAVTGDLTVRQCTFRDNVGAAPSGHYAGGGGLFINGGTLVVEDCLFTRNSGVTRGGALRARQCSAVTINSCTFSHNTADVGGGLQIIDCGQLDVRGCAFDENTAEQGGGGMLVSWVDSVRVVGCSFTGNQAPNVAGVGVDRGNLDVSNCLFAHNLGDLMGGGLVCTPLTARLVNVVFIGNEAQYGAGLLLAAGPASPTLINCTLALNVPHGLASGQNTPAPELTNCIIWGNTGGAIGSDYGGFVATPTITFSDVQGGLPGSGNIDADPLFVQPGMENLRLAFGSPCADAGDTGALPADELDLDGDGDTAEPVPIDLAGAPRVVNGAVDMGALEGEFEPLPPADAGQADQGEWLVLVPSGGAFQPVQQPAVEVTNMSGPDGSTDMATELDDPVHPEALGYSQLASVLDLETSASGGQFFATLYLPFDQADLAGADPAGVRLTCYDPATGNWSLAVAANTTASPGQGGPIGSFIYSGPPNGFGVTEVLGDYGVFWSPGMARGFAWANVDHTSEFGAGISLCPADCAQAPDGVVSVRDFLSLLSAWGTSTGHPCDLTADGTVGLDDFYAILSAWGPCPQQPVSAQQGRVPGAPVAGAPGRNTQRSPRRGPALPGWSGNTRDWLDALVRWGAPAAGDASPATAGRRHSGGRFRAGGRR